MAIVIINGKSLQVWDREAPGGLGRTEKVILAERALDGAKPEEIPNLLAGVVLAYVGENEGVDLAWLKANLPASPYSIIHDCGRASGLPAKDDAPGEAKGP